MHRTELPKIGIWYLASGEQRFEVVATDSDDLTIEIQHYDGTIEELELENWMELSAMPTAEPEDWSGSFDVNTEDLPAIDTPLAAARQNPLDRLEKLR